MKTLTIAILSIIAVGSIGTSYALITHNDNVDIFGNLNVREGNFVTIRTGGGDIGNAMKNNGGASVYTFSDLDDGQVYRMKLTGDGKQFQFLSFTDGNRKDIVVDTITGKVGISTTNPQEALDVGGNLRVQGGKITSGGDICIGTCP